MSANFEQRLIDLDAKMRLIKQRYGIVVMQRNEALDKLAKAQSDLIDARNRIQELSNQVDYLRMASAIEAANGNLEQSRKFLSELVWEIDKCISQLSE